MIQSRLNNLILINIENEKLTVDFEDIINDFVNLKM